MVIPDIKFGTDDGRSVIADGFTIDNVRLVTQATCEAIRKKERSKLIVVGYDRRFFSRKFATAAARVAAANGYKVEISDEPISSPALSFQTKSRKAAIGIMITASHNPYYFSGFKLKGPHGGSVDSTLTTAIEGQLDVKPLSSDSVSIKTVGFVDGYISWLKKIAPTKIIQKLKHPIVFDAMHGPGGRLLEELVGKSTHIVYLRNEVDPLFGGHAPEPIEVHLEPLKQAVLQKHAAMGVAVDGDVDRIGAVDDRGRYLPPHTVMPLILLHLIENRKMRGKVVQTVSMGYLPGRIAKHFGLSFEEVPVGFKHIAEKMGQEKVLLGGEESGGYGVGVWSPERDGLLCALLLTEMIAMSRKKLSELVDDLYARFGASHFKRVDFNLRTSVDKAPWTEKIVANVTPELAGLKVASVNPVDGVKITLDDGSWVLMRPSGTEPLIRTYSEGTTGDIVEKLLKEADRLVHLPDKKKELSAAAKKIAKARQKAKK